MQAVLCFGNEWQGDDGFGLAVYESLNNREIPETCKLYFCANNALRVPQESLKAERIIIVDAYQTENSPIGQLNWESSEDFLTQRPQNSHDGGVEEFIRHLPILTQSGHTPAIDIMYITVAPISAFNNELSAIVKARISDAADEIMTALESQGIC